MMIALLGGGAVFCFFMVFYFWMQYRREKKQVHEQFDQFAEIASQDRWSDRLADKLDETQWAKQLEPRLKRASIKIRPSEYGAILFMVGFSLVLFLYYGMGAPLWIGLMIGTTLVPFISKMFLESRRNIYVRRVESQLSEVCRLLSSAARAGLSIPQGLELVVKEMAPPVRDELAIVVRELQLGKDLEKSLQDLYRRVNSRDVRIFINALIIQQRAGGDLGAVLGEMAGTMEERKIISKTIDASISQSKYTAYFLPVISALMVYMMSQMIDDFFDFFTSMMGLVVLTIFVVMQVVGFLLIKKISDIKV
ncbi:type II secretion system F family protein [Melghirimyces algeriensis]|uniref:Tight adherence protein B n=1 Tax=Melghirimyces algeriensis TaxID=910412 RepID=A0A521E980_9BACL|nr:type II secretion system F family protein [Melghirimyces algeriensis]SMO80518.1 tight adherence protein B [Melghirimyces algeriensis]